jgi:hypothetical protein
MVNPAFRDLCWSLLAFFVMSCAGSQPAATSGAPASAGGTIPPADSSEQEVLDRVGNLPPRAAVRVQGLTVFADYPYTAASGRTCRRLTLTRTGRQPTDRMACSDGKSWFFVPSVFVTGTETHP